MKLSPLNRRRLNNFKKNRRAVCSFWIFSLLFGLSLFAEFIANDKPILVSYRGELFVPVMRFYPETAFGGDFQTEATYRDPEVQCLIRSGGLEICFDDPEGTMAAIDAGDFGVQVAEFSQGWMLWPPVPYSYDTPNDLGRSAPSPPDASHWLGTDDTTRDV
ncbi:MAG: ABC transporter permease, partial [Planktomarina sp.]|nr:ABC transporter permease [Planktomarina sp.]